jgi:hypothetical protein
MQWMTFSPSASVAPRKIAAGWFHRQMTTVA